MRHQSLNCLLACSVDHIGVLRHLTSLQRLLDTGRAYVKLSAPYRLGNDLTDFEVIAARLAQSHPQRLLWGTDWPHTELWADVPDDADLVDAAMAWLPTDAIRQAVFVDNPQSLFF